MQHDDATNDNLNNLERIERQRINEFIQRLGNRWEVAELHISPIGSKSPYDGWVSFRKPEGTLFKVLFEAKVRSYNSSQREDDFLNVNKFLALKRNYFGLACQAVWHLAFYPEGVFIYNLTPAILDETDLPRQETYQKPLFSDPRGQKERYNKYQLRHNSPQCKFLAYQPA